VKKYSSSPQLKKGDIGFTLIEVIIVVAIIGILASIAVPAYETYILRSKFIEATLETKPAKNAIIIALETKFKSNGNRLTLSDLQAGGFGIDSSSLPSITRHGVDVVNGNIIVTWRNDGSKLEGITYELKPDTSEPPISWSISGTCIINGYC
jgi:type IV pilus assembly protein PilA